MMLSSSSDLPTYFNPRPPRGGRQKTEQKPTARGRRISIHAPREGGDLDGVVDGDACVISIHAPREGGDMM